MEERRIIKQEGLSRVEKWRVELRKECREDNCPSLCLHYCDRTMIKSK